MSEQHAEQCMQQEDRAFEMHCAEVAYAEWLKQQQEKENEQHI